MVLRQQFSRTLPLCPFLYFYCRSHSSSYDTTKDTWGSLPRRLLPFDLYEDWFLTGRETFITYRPLLPTLSSLLLLSMDLTVHLRSVESVVPTPTTVMFVVYVVVPEVILLNSKKKPHHPQSCLCRTKDFSLYKWGPRPFLLRTLSLRQ